MKKDAWKWMALGGLIAVAVMYGMELTGSGAVRTYGPHDRGVAVGEAGVGAGAAGTDARGDRSHSVSREQGATESVPVLAEPAGAEDDRRSVPAADMAGNPDSRGYDADTGGDPDGSGIYGEGGGYGLNEPARTGNGGEGGFLPVLPARSGDPAISRLADGTAGLLQQASSGGIRLVVRLFDDLMG